MMAYVADDYFELSLRKRHNIEAHNLLWNFNVNKYNLPIHLWLLKLNKEVLPIDPKELLKSIKTGRNEI